jgi:hypothetical protein
MAFVHGKETVVKVDANDLSAYVNTSEFTRGADEHDVTTYGKDDGVYQGGIRRHQFVMSGVYDSTAGTGPRGVLGGAEGTSMAIIRQPEGTGSGLPQDSFNGLLTSYVETNPVADMIAWSATFRVSGPVTDTAQSA